MTWEPCGCWSGFWNASTPPPDPCILHYGSLVNIPIVSSSDSPNVINSGNPSVFISSGSVNFGPSSYGSMSFIAGPANYGSSYPAVVSGYTTSTYETYPPQTLAVLIGRAETEIKRLAKAALDADEIAEHDAWQMALSQLVGARTWFGYAEKARSG